MKIPIIPGTRREIISIIGSGFTGTTVGKGFEHNKETTEEVKYKRKLEDTA